MDQLASMIKIIKISKDLISEYRKSENKEANDLNAFVENFVSAEFDDLLDEITVEIEMGSDTEEKEYIPPQIVPSDNVIISIQLKFRYIRQLGKGASCRVWKARNLQNRKIYAVKELSKGIDINFDAFCKEVELLKKLIHPNILKYYDCYEDEKRYYIATEFCSGGTMLDKIVKMKSFSEKKASEYIKTILSAVNYMHSLNIVHRDLKAQNLVFDKEGSDGVLQLIDFGDSKIIKEHKSYDEFVGTIHYVPPEVIRSRTGAEMKKSDLWSIGIITYLLVCGRIPFSGKSNKQILQNIVASKTKTFTYPKKSNLSDSCKDFLEHLLCYDTNKRLSASEALQHPWICGNMASTDNLSSDFLRSLKKYNYGNKLQNILVDAILTEMSEDEQETLNEGILEMNRKTPQMDGTSVVDFLLLNSQISMDNAYEMAVNPYQKRRSQVEMNQMAALKEDGALFNDDVDWDKLDIDGILDEADEKEKKSADIKDNPKMIDTISDPASDDDVDVDVDYKHLSLAEAGQSTEMSMSPFSPSPLSPEVDHVNKKISVPRFRAIIKQSSKRYNVEEIVKDLDDGMGNIALDDIAAYHKKVDTVESLDVGSIFDESPSHSMEEIE